MESAKPTVRLMPTETEMDRMKAEVRKALAAVTDRCPGIKKVVGLDAQIEVAVAVQTMKFYERGQAEAWAAAQTRIAALEARVEDYRRALAVARDVRPVA